MKRPPAGFESRPGAQIAGSSGRAVTAHVHGRAPDSGRQVVNGRK
jgi:hypothetical protein